MEVVSSLYEPPKKIIAYGIRQAQIWAHKSKDFNVCMPPYSNIMGVNFGDVYLWKPFMQVFEGPCDLLIYFEHFTPA